MRIISNFKDYYDTAISFGIDPNIHYKRFKTAVKYSDQQLIHLDAKYSILYSYNSGEIKIESFLIFFCGELHFGYKISKPIKNSIYRDEKIVYSLSEIKKFFAGVKEETYHVRKKWYSLYKTYVDHIKEYEENRKYVVNKLEDWHLELQSPIIMVGEDLEKKDLYKPLMVVCNPRLSVYSFQKVKEPTTAFQELSMYLSNKFGMPGNEMVEVSDKTKIEKHGYDKWSFRKQGKNSK